MWFAAVPKSRCVAIAARLNWRWHSAAAAGTAARSWVTTGARWFHAARARVATTAAAAASRGRLHTAAWAARLCLVPAFAPGGLIAAVAVV